MSGDVTEIQLSTRLDFSTMVLAVLAFCLHSYDAIASTQNPKDTRILVARVSTPSFVIYALSFDMSAKLDAIAVPNASQKESIPGNRSHSPPTYQRKIRGFSLEPGWE